MKCIKCNIAQNGYFAGPIFKIQSDFDIKREEGFDVNEQKERFKKACDSLIETIELSGNTKKNEEISRTVIELLHDESFINPVMSNLESMKCSASFAVWEASRKLCAELDMVQNEYIRSRTDDVRGLALKLISILEGKSNKPMECSAIVSSEISPAMISSFDEELVGALLSVKGSPISHASIMADNLGIPYLYGSEEAAKEASDATFVIIDSEKGCVVLDPSEEEKKIALERMNKLSKMRIEEAEREYEESKKAMNCRTKIYANIGGPEDIEELKKSGADGVGLFRTEFMFLNSDKAPGEEEQLEVYRDVLKVMEGKEVIIRTMDIGSEKSVSWLNLPKEINPALGLRGVRVSLENRELFNVQLRALLRAAVSGNLKIMFPMITSEWEIDEIKRLIKKAAKELDNEKLEYRIPEIGIMIETPAAAVCADELAKKVSFFSIGTNDLAQYSLAIDRSTQGIDKYFEAGSEAVFRLIGMVAKAGSENNISVGVCGQLAADVGAIKRLILEGVDELSVPVKKVRKMRILAAKVEAEI